MSHCYLSSKSKNNMREWYFESFIADYFWTFNKKDPVVIWYLKGYILDWLMDEWTLVIVELLLLFKIDNLKIENTGC